MMRRLITLTMATCSFAVVLTAGCSEQPGSDSSPLAVSLQKESSVAIGREPASSYESRLEELRLLAATGDVKATADATNSLLSQVDSDVEAGRTTADEGLAVAQGAQQAVIDVDIDVHFGTNEKCDAQFNCTKAKQMCVTVTWHVEGVGGGRNCYNWGGQAN